MQLCLKHIATSAFVLGASIAFSPSVSAQTEFNVLDAKTDSPRKMLSAYLMTETQKHFNARRVEIAKLKTPADVHKRQETMRTRMIEALGGFPEKTPLNGQVVGIEKRAGYRVERIIYESRPHHHVTANLYVPNGKGPFPCVLIVSGHDGAAKAGGSNQRMAMLLAKEGLAAFAIDPIGQAERRQLLDQPGKAAITSMTNEHTLIGVGALLVGQNTATYRIWDGIRGLDYLSTRPEIIKDFYGCTGCSGGGTLTSYLMALDERIGCAAPSCYITSLERLFTTRGPQDAEQNITGQVALGIEHADYVTMRAPRATLIATATQDFFDIQGSWTTFREASQIYGILGHSERVNLVEYNTTHGYPKPQREAIARWMKRFLAGKDERITEPEFTTAKYTDLQCTRSGQVLEDFKGKSAFQISMEYDVKFAKERSAKLAKQSREETLKDVRRMIGLPDQIKAATLRPVGDEVLKAGNLRYRKYIFETEAGIQVPALHFLSKKGKLPILVLHLHGSGKAMDTEPNGPIEKQIDAGNEVLAIDVRGMGETSPAPLPVKPGYFGVDFRESYLALHLNRPLLGQRVYDVLAVMEYLQGEQTTFAKTVYVWGIAGAGPVALHAGAIDSRFRGVVTNRSVVSWAEVVRSPINYNQLTNVVPGALKVYDLPDLAGLIAPRITTIQAGVNPQLEVVSQAALEKAYAEARKVVQSRKGDLGLFADPSK